MKIWNCPNCGSNCTGVGGGAITPKCAVYYGYCGDCGMRGPEAWNEPLAIERFNSLRVLGGEKIKLMFMVYVMKRTIGWLMVGLALGLAIAIDDMCWWELGVCYLIGGAGTLLDCNALKKHDEIKGRLADRK